MFLPIAILFVLSQSVAEALIGRDQSGGAFGYLTCEGKPYQGALVKLYDRDRGLDLDDLMAKTYSDANGYYELQGYTDEITTIDLMLNFYHDCRNTHICSKKFRIHLPDSYVTPGQKPEKLFDGGIIALDSTFPNQSYDCIHFMDIKAHINGTGNSTDLEPISEIVLE